MNDNTDALPPMPETVKAEAESAFAAWWTGRLPIIHYVKTVQEAHVFCEAYMQGYRAALAQRQQVPGDVGPAGEFGKQFGCSGPIDLTAAPSAQAEPQMVAPQDGMQFWLWKNGDHFLAFTHLYPCFTPGGDPMVLGEPVGRAVFRRSFHRSGRGNAIGPAQPELPKARSLTDELMDCVDRLGSEAKDVDPRVWDHLRVYMPAPPTAQAEPQEPLPVCAEKPHAVYVEGYGYVDAKAVRAIERAHGIGKQESK